MCERVRLTWAIAYVTGDETKMWLTTAVQFINALSAEKNVISASKSEINCVPFPEPWQDHRSALRWTPAERHEPRGNRIVCPWSACLLLRSASTTEMGTRLRWNSTFPLWSIDTVFHWVSGKSVQGMGALLASLHMEVQQWSAMPSKFKICSN